MGQLGHVVQIAVNVTLNISNVRKVVRAREVSVKEKVERGSTFKLRDSENPPSQARDAGF